LRARGHQLVLRADPACESVGETRTRLLLTDHGLPVRSQVEICDEVGGLVGRVDLLVGDRVIVEFDGAVKYEGAEGRAALVAEKRREDALRALGYVVVRVTWADLASPGRLIAQIRRAMAGLSARDGRVSAS
jgi:very-short-patch-repair endonuclease